MFKKRFFKSIFVVLFGVFMIPFFLLPLSANAAATGPITADQLFGDGYVNPADVQDATGLGDRDPREIIASVIRVVLGFLGIIAVLIILYAGFLWMTAAGNDDKISTAKSMMSAGVIGLIIILAAFGVANFVMTALVDATA